MMSDLYTLSYSQIQKAINEKDKNALTPYDVSILRNVMLEPIETYFRFLGFQLNLDIHMKFGQFDQIFQEAVEGDKDLFSERTGCVSVFLFLEQLSPRLSHAFLSLSKEAVETEKKRICEFIDNVLIGIRKQTKAPILWHAFELSAYPVLGIVESQDDSFQLGVVQQLNAYLKKRLIGTPDAYFVDINLCLLRIGAKNFYDHRYWHIGQAPYSREAYREIAVEDFKFLRAFQGKSKKCLILDCDDTLWGGVIGEDGLAKIQLGKTYPGCAFYEFQQEILNLYGRGVILALCSRNNPEDVWEVFRKHPDMVLKEECIAAFQINWENKATNIRRLAEDLNIGLDSMVFVDNSEFEINLIRQILPEVETILLPRDRSVEYRQILASCGLFDSLSFSSEDKNRGQMYKADVARKKLTDQFVDIESYYKSLDMVTTIRFADEFSVPRIAQLTQRTNQFNLTTRRYSEDDIRSFIQDKQYDLVYLHVKDQFGDLGVVGVSVLKYISDEAVIDTFLLSCRVLGRRIEDLFLEQVLKLAAARGKKNIVAEFRATAKNSLAKDFYPKRGFRAIEGDEKNYRFRYNPASRAVSPAPYFQVVSDIDTMDKR